VLLDRPLPFLNFLIAGPILTTSVFLTLLLAATATSRSEICEGLPPYVLQPDEKSCDKFFICIEGNPVYGVCPDNYRFKKTTSECAKQETVTCDIVEEVKPKQDVTASRVDDNVEQLEKEVVEMEVAVEQVNEKLEEVKAKVKNSRAESETLVFEDIVEGSEEILVVE
jgi:Chitin binding Peritrophin-A domain